MKAEIISIGRELLLGETVDTNASFIAKQLPFLGIDLVWITAVGDIQLQLVEALKRAWHRSDLTITTGGLGPTGDDLTRESVAELMGEQMIVIPELERKLHERFRGYGMPQMPQSNLKQCTLIPSSEAINNDLGTAPGWWVEKDGHIIICMPGPPREMQEMWEREIRQRLQKRSKQVILARTWKTFGYSEAAVGEMTFPLFPENNPSLGVYAKPDGIQVQLKVTAANDNEARQQIAEGEKKIKVALGDVIWGIDDETLEMAIGRLLVNRGLTIALVEDYSGGWLAAHLGEVPFSHRFLKGGVITPDDSAKIALGISSDQISVHGSVSPQIASSLAEIIKNKFSTSIGIGITGITENPPQVGFTYVAINDGIDHVITMQPRSKQRLVTAVLFALRKLLI